MLDRFYLFLIRNDVWIYIVSAMGLFWYGLELIRAQRQLGRAMFNIERETATRLRNNALNFVIFFTVIIGIVYYVNARVAPNLPQELFTPPTPTPNIFVTPLASPSPLSEEGQATAQALAKTPQVAPTVTLPPELGGEPAPEAPLPEGQPTAEQTPEAIATAFTGCTPELGIIEPRDGSVAFSSITFRGTADTGEAHAFVVELNGPQTAGEWAPLTTSPVPQPVIEAELGAADLSQWADGPYLARLRALDAQDREVGQCVIQFTLDNR